MFFVHTEYCRNSQIWMVVCYSNHKQHFVFIYVYVQMCVGVSLYQTRTVHVLKFSLSSDALFLVVAEKNMIILRVQLCTRSV